MVSLSIVVPVKESVLFLYLTLYFLLLSANIWYSSCSQKHCMVTDRCCNSGKYHRELKFSLEFCKYLWLTLLTSLKPEWSPLTIRNNILILMVDSVLTFSSWRAENGKSTYPLVKSQRAREWCGTMTFCRKVVIAMVKIS